MRRLGTSVAAIALVLAGGAATARDGTQATAKTAPAAATPWDAFLADTLEQWFRLVPTYAVYQGRHDFDGQLPDWSEAGLKRMADMLRATIAKARAFPGLTPEQRYQRDYVVQTAEGYLFWIADADQPHRNPSWYVGGGLDPNVYIARPYADAPTRMRALIKFFRGIPTAAEQIRANLKGPLPLSYINFGTAAFGGFADFYANDAKQAFAEVKDPALQREFSESSAAAAAAMRGVRDHLERQRATATTDYALGADRFARMLKATEGVDVPIAELERIGQADLKRNQDALKAACARFAPGADIPACMAKMNADKPKGGVVVAARAQIPELRKFVEEKGIVTIPDAEQALVEESPPYNRQNSAYIDPPGPYDKGIPSVYYISPPDPSWSKEVQDGYIPGEPDLLFTTVHEVMPGHFLQFRHANRSNFLFGRVFVGYAFAEGWAHYTEEMMWDAGLRGTPETHVGQLSNALLRNCRYLSAIGLHTGRMTQAQSEAMFREQCYQDEGNAKQQAARGTYDPAYLNYTMGKLMIRKLREDWTASRGGRRAWKAFHDQFLGFGGPPIPLVRQQMMGEATARAVF